LIPGKPDGRYPAHHCKGGLVCFAASASMTSDLLPPREPPAQARGMWLPWLMGTGATVLSLSVAHALKSSRTPASGTLALVFLVLVFAFCAGFARSRMPRRSASVAGMFYLGIPVGVVIDVVIDAVLFSHGRNLFPIEIMILCVVAAIPVAAGMYIGRFFEIAPAAPAPAHEAPAAMAPALWDPLATALWSLVLTPVFGSYLQMRNWQALAQPARARRAWLWMLGWLAASVIGWLSAMIAGESPRTGGAIFVAELVLQLAWWAIPTREQFLYARDHLGGRYRRRSWAQPLFVAAAIIAATFFVNMLAAPMFQAAMK